ncbi:MmcQ/YjbR family DNA-binding protein [Phenylobacterium sp.]|uniref:MmcQ/YjbR family DNA-binding protein n=1 Tax=Phenylobacterium sp. TaxID=1871053 RepID=UPI0025E29742|nr:MmcQ/YjbR family DNA-binding protein [Phenylobacterium sp.]MBX3483648.1 MmcQ/YjbR family DNA-binding protein [Phenylobacterium sp.]MCW5760789.1 MmcQ/YjbR family DNA-binding protein [Phenylobacterium sp.]
MVGVPEIRALAAALPEAADACSETHLGFTVGGKGFAWTYLVRETPKGKRLPRIDVLAVRCDLARKEMLIAAAPERFFDDDHYRGYPAVLVRLARIEADELAALFREAWRLSAPKAVLKRYPGI